MYRAERLTEAGTLESLEHAVRLTPTNSDAWSRLGELLERRGDSAGAAGALTRALELNRYDAGVWVNLALHWESEGDAKKAEQYLREAARVDGTFFPRWALANFYLRQEGPDQFWTAIRDAMSRNRADLPAAFELCWRAFDDVGEILEKAIPDLPEINRQYCQFLLETRRTAAVAGVWKRIAGQLQSADFPLARQYVNALLADRQVDDAVQVWNGLCQTGLVQFKPLDLARGPLLTNGNFLVPPSALAFDWRVAEAEGVIGGVENSAGRPSLRLRLSGTHPESIELLSQLAPAVERATYRVKYRYSTAGLPINTGLYWTIEDAAGGEKLLITPPLAAQEDWKEDSTTFQTGPKTRLIRVIFAYRRSPGTTRVQGSVALTDVDLSPARRVRPVQP